MEFLFEIIFEFYIELMMLVVPKSKQTSKAFRFFAIMIAFIAMLAIIALFIWGIVLLGDSNWIGLILMVLSVVLSIVQIFAGLYLNERNEKR